VPWSIDLRRLLLQAYPLPEHVSPISEDTLLQPKWLLEFAGPKAKSSNSMGSTTASESREVLTKLPPGDLLPINGSITATLVQNTRVTPSTHWQDVRHLILSVTSPVQYAPGDVLTIFPKNFPEEVDQLLTLMDWTSIADIPIQFIPSNISVEMQAYPPPPVPHLLSYPKLTLRSLLTHYLDITSIPRRSFFSLIAHFTNDDMHKERLLEFTDPKYIDELYDYTTRPRRSILEVLQEFKSVRIPWQWVATVIPALRGRQFSIASGGALKLPTARDESPGSRIELLVAVVKYRTVIKKIRQGVCTRYIASLPVGTDLAVVVQKGSLNIANSSLSKPAVMVGPGTGVAPMRALIWERFAAKDEMQTRHQTAPGNLETIDGKKGCSLPSAMGQNVLFFGCRNNDADYFFRDEWDELRRRGHLEVFTAFSRDQVSFAPLIFHRTMWG
jgi:sulfite reductase alpha subunit-like flavoprotein